jgi:uncharacterized protein YjbI with pentapeptide repeats
MNEQDRTQTTALERPTTDDKRAWEAYWAAIQPKEWFEAWGYWRTEPEIDEVRKIYLTERRAIQPDIKKGTYPFKNIKLSRADVEWLLATLENGCGPIDWNDESQRKRDGLDLRGAILNKSNLSGLPLACMLGGLGSSTKVTSTGETILTTPDQRAKAAVHMEGTDLFKAHLEGANLSRGRLNRANIRDAHLKKAEFFYAHVENAYLGRSHLENAILRGCHLQGTSLHKAHLEGAELRRAIFNNETYLEGIYLGNQEYGYALLADISWGDANLAVMDWAVLQMLGDEQILHQWKTKQGVGRMPSRKLCNAEKETSRSRWETDISSLCDLTGKEIPRTPKRAGEKLSDMWKAGTRRCYTIL